MNLVAHPLLFYKDNDLFTALHDPLLGRLGEAYFGDLLVVLGRVTDERSGFADGSIAVRNLQGSARRQLTGPGEPDAVGRHALRGDAIREGFSVGIRARDIELQGQPNALFAARLQRLGLRLDRKSTRLNSSH